MKIKKKDIKKIKFATYARFSTKEQNEKQSKSQ